MRAGLFSEIKSNPWVLAFVILIHVSLIVLLSINLSSDKKPPMPMAQKHNIIDAVAVDAKKYDERDKQKKLDVEKIAIEKKRQQESEREKALEMKRLAEQKAAEVKRQQELERKKSQDKEKQLALAKKKEQERLTKEKLAADKLAAEKRAEEKKALEKKEAERKEQERLAAEKKRLAEEERQRREAEKAELERALFEEERREEEARRLAERTTRLQTQRSQYVMSIANKVENNWLRPATNIDGQSCDVIVTQTMAGDVIDVRLQDCTSDNAFQRSVERAVRKASPLPLPPDPELFDRQIYFTFKPH
jgi:colicin import membrane protein